MTTFARSVLLFSILSILAPACGGEIQTIEEGVDQTSKQIGDAPNEEIISSPLDPMIVEDVSTDACEMAGNPPPMTSIVLQMNGAPGSVFPGSSTYVGDRLGGTYGLGGFLATYMPSSMAWTNFIAFSTSGVLTPITPTMLPGHTYYATEYPANNGHAGFAISVNGRRCTNGLTAAFQLVERRMNGLFYEGYLFKFIFHCGDEASAEPLVSGCFRFWTWTPPQP